MIREQFSDDRLFYTHDEIAKPASGNFYMRLSEVVGDWRELASPLSDAFSKKQGRPTDPVVYLKIFLVGYLENIIYDTDLAERISDSIAIRRFVGYALSENTPDHSSISRNRALIGAHCKIEDVLSTVVELCRKKGLVDGELSAVDSSLVPANASLSSLRSVRTGKRVSEHLREVEEKNKTLGADELGQRENPTASNQEFRSGTDPDARIAKKRGQKRAMYYKATHVTDGKSGVILAAGVSHADEGEVKAAKPVLGRAKENLEQCGLRLRNLTADAGYDAADFHAYIERLGGTPVTNWQPDTKQKAEGFKKESFLYDATSDCYVCPEGSILRYGSFNKSTGLHLYRSDPRRCVNCEHKNKCIDGERNKRTVTRHPNAASRERNIAKCCTDEGQRALRRRREIAEAPFGHMKTYGGLRTISCRGKAKAHVKVVMAAIAYDLMKLVRAGSRDRAECRSAVCAIASGILYAVETAYWMLLDSSQQKLCHNPT